MVANGDICSDHEWVSVGCVRPVMGAMEHRKVLYITPCTHFDGVDIAPQDGSRPDGDASAEVHLSNDRGIRININTPLRSEDGGSGKRG